MGEKQSHSSYFRVTNPLPQVCRLEDPRGVFLTLIVGDRHALLVDTGMGVGDVSGAVAALTDKPVIVANTHGHIDHAGGNYQFESVWLAAEDHPIVQEQIDQEQKKRVLTLEDAPLPAQFDQERFFAYHGGNLLPLKAGWTFDLGGLSVTAIPLPSHTKGSMGFFCPELMLLLTGDSISAITYLVFHESSSVFDHIRIMEEVQAFPFSMMLSAHEPNIMDRKQLQTFLRCAKELRPEEAIRFRNPLFPDIRGKMYVCQDSCCPNGYAALVFTDDKLDGAATL